MSEQRQFRIILWGVSTSGWRGTQAAVVYDAKSIGVEEHANDVGSAYWTLNNDHPQIAEFQPLRRHYEISRWSDARNRWEFIGAGILNDYTVTEYETTFSGIDYKAVLNQVFTPLTNITFANASPINPNLATVQKTTVFNSTDGVEGTDQVFGSSYDVNGRVVFDVVDTMTVSAATVSAIANTTKTINITSGTSTYTASVETPYLQLTYSLEWTGSTSLTGGFTGSFGGLSWTGGFANTPIMRVAVFASPPAAQDLGDPPVGSTGRIAEFNIAADSSSGANRFKAQNRVVDILPFSAREELYTALVAAGAASATVASTLIETPTGSANKTGTQTVYAFRNGLTYSLDLYAGIYAAFSTSINKWFVSTGSKAKSTDEVTLGQGTDDISAIVSRVFLNAKTSNSYSRIRYASLTVSGATYTTHTTYSAGQPSLDHIGDICDLEMGARGGGSKAIFGIDKPAYGSSYAGNFKLTLNVSSSGITTGPSLRYPENIKTYSFSPGFAKVRNNITIIPTERYLSGSTAQGSGGAQIIGASASDSASINAYGNIPLVASKGGFINAASAQNEANRMLTLYGSLDTTKTPSIPKNTKQVALRVTVDGIDPFYNWDVGDSINVSIKHGLVDVAEPFVISGVRWFGESDGHELLELDLVQGSSFAAAFGGGGGQSSSGAPSTGIGSPGTVTPQFIRTSRR
jgi:hypothetical protein